MAARNMLQKGVLIVQRDNLAGAQPAHIGLVELIFAHRLDMQVERQAEIEAFNGSVPVARRNFAQLAADQIERTRHQVVHRLSAGALGGKFVDQAHQQRHHQKADEEQQIELDKQFSHAWVSHACGANR